MLTQQEAFTKVWHHFVTNRGPASYTKESNVTNNKCLYRGPEGARCAAGLLIEDDEYREEFDCNENGTSMDANSVFRQIPRLAHLANLVDPYDNFLRRLQKAHDYAVIAGGDFHGWVQRNLRKLAIDFNLEIPE
jgi:hypothetical protein